MAKEYTEMLLTVFEKYIGTKPDAKPAINETLLLFVRRFAIKRKL